MSDRWKDLNLPPAPRLLPPPLADVEPLPVTPAGKWATLEAWLSPVYVETCPCCGQDVERRGEPLVSLDAALELSGLKP